MIRPVPALLLALAACRPAAPDTGPVAGPTDEAAVLDAAEAMLDSRSEPSTAALSATAARSPAQQ
jgi:hypothetical protein